MFILDALEVKMLKDPENVEEESENVAGFTWDIMEFTQFQTKLKIRWRNPKSVGAF